MLLGQVHKLILKGKKIKWWKERQIEEMESEKLASKVNEVCQSSESPDKDEIV